MSFLKNCRVSFRRAPPENDPEASNFAHSVLLEDKFMEGALLFESGAIAQLTADDLSSRRLYYTKAADASACLGILTLPTASPPDVNISSAPSFLVLATTCVSVAKFSDHEVYRITSVQFISLLYPQTEDDGLAEVRKLLSSGAFYFARSPDTGAPYDLTMNTQTRASKNSCTSSGGIHLRSNTELNYLWNGGLLSSLLQWGIDPDQWFVSVICGSFETSTVYSGASQVRMGVVSRVSCRRPGTRFHSRGVNDRGYVANFVETEQFIHCDNVVLSHVQLRGTVPLFWEQPGIQVGSHKVQLSRTLNACQRAYERHFSHIISQYSATAIVNLVGSKQGEGVLGQAYRELHNKSGYNESVAQVIFDYHTEVQNRGTQSLDWLQKQLDRFIGVWGYFCAVDGQIQQCQTGALRINCVDCLDRTNAVQTLVGVNLVLPRMLNHLTNVLDSQQTRMPRFVDSLRQIWLQNGDQVSRIYAGTGALGSNRSRLRDVQRSAARTLQHSLFDSAKQGAMRTLLSPSNLEGRLKSITDRYLPRQYQWLPRPILTELVQRHDEFTCAKQLRIFVGTWNVNGGKHFRSVAHKHESITDWLLNLPRTVRDDWGYRNPNYTDDQIQRQIDIFAIGFEEIVDLTTSNIVAGSKPSANQRDWGQFIQEHLNKATHPVDPYALVGCVQLVGVCLFVFVRSRLAIHLRDTYLASVKTGLGGTAGNKGGVAFSFQLGCTSICFVCSHFAAGQNSVTERNEDFGEICRRLKFRNGSNILSHDYVFWCGDFNYRINLSGGEVKRLIAQSAWLDLLRSDQLTLERESGNVFQGFQEGFIRFAPTYKYDLFCDDYDTSEKCRVPAWTDRILWRRLPIQVGGPEVTDDNVPFDSDRSNPLVLYSRAEMKTSDHRPVGAIFDIHVHVVSPESRRRVALETLKSYGPIHATVQLTMYLIETVSRSSVHLDDCPINPFRRNDFILLLKTVGSTQSCSVKLIHFGPANTAFLTYSDTRQAVAAVGMLDGHSFPWGNPIGLPQIDGGYEVNIRASLKSDFATDDLDWQAFVDKAESEDDAEQGPRIPDEAFHVLKMDGARDVLFDLGEGLARTNLIDLKADESQISDKKPQRQPPPRPAPPARPPAPIFSQPLLGTHEALPLVSAIDVDMLPSPIQSTHSSPSRGHQNSTSEEPEFLLLSPIDSPVVSSCINLFELDTSETPTCPTPGELPIDRPASSTDLTTSDNQVDLPPPIMPTSEHLVPPVPPPRRKPPKGPAPNNPPCLSRDPFHSSLQTSSSSPAPLLMVGRDNFLIDSNHSSLPPKPPPRLFPPMHNTKFAL